MPPRSNSGPTMGPFTRALCLREVADQLNNVDRVVNKELLLIVLDTVLRKAERQKLDLLTEYKHWLQLKG